MLLSSCLVSTFDLGESVGVTLTPEEFGKRLREAREGYSNGAGMSQAALARAGDVTQSYISQLERGEGTGDRKPVEMPNVYMVRAFEQALGLYPNYLTDPPEVFKARETAIEKMLERYRTDLRITGDEERYIKRSAAFFVPSGDPDLIYWSKLLEYVRAAMALENKERSNHQ